MPILSTFDHYEIWSQLPTTSGQSALAYIEPKTFSKLIEHIEHAPVSRICSFMTLPAQNFDKLFTIFRFLNDNDVGIKYSPHFIAIIHLFWAFIHAFITHSKTWSHFAWLHSTCTCICITKYISETCAAFIGHFNSWGSHLSASGSQYPSSLL